MKKYKITLNRNQLVVLSEACEMLARLHAGQWKTVLDDQFRFKYKNLYKKMDDVFYKKIAECKKQVLGLEDNESWGIMHSNMHRSADTAWDLYQITRIPLGDTRTVFRTDKKNVPAKVEEVK